MRGFVRTSVAVPVVAIADPAENALRTLALWQQAHDDGVALVLAAPHLWWPPALAILLVTACAQLAVASRR